MRKDIKASCQKRLSRIEGQVRGLSKMVDEDRYCIDIVTQISAVRAALRRVEEEVLKDHVSHCVEHAIASGDKIGSASEDIGIDGGHRPIRPIEPRRIAPQPSPARNRAGDDLHGDAQTQPTMIIQVQARCGS